MNIYPVFLHVRVATSKPIQKESPIANLVYCALLTYPVFLLVPSTRMTSSHFHPRVVRPFLKFS